MTCNGYQNCCDKAANPNFPTLGNMCGSDTQQVDVAIIGAGAAGLYCAYRLLRDRNSDRSPPVSKIALFEAEQRVGGRVFSTFLTPNSKPVELGAMRYLSNHKIIHSLVQNVIAKHSDKQSVDFGFRNAFHYTDGARLTPKSRRHDYEEPQPDLYTLNGEIREGMSYDEIMEMVALQVLSADGCLEKLRNESKNCHKRWNDLKPTLRYRFPGSYQNWYVNDMSLEQLLLDRVGEKTYGFLRQSDAFDSTYAASASYGLETYVEEFTAESEYRTVEGGLGVVMSFLADEIRNMGGTIYLGHQLTKFVRANPAIAKYELSLHDKLKNCHHKFFANNLILCIPKRGLEQLNRNSHLFETDKARGGAFEKALYSVREVPTLKLVLGFDQPWWEKSIGRYGKTVTNLPIRQSFYFGHGNANSSLSTVLVSYTDMEGCAFWQHLQNRKEDESNNRRIGGSDLQKLGYEKANPFVVNEALTQLQKVHGENITISRPVTSAFMDWSKDPHGGGYHHWKPGAKGWEVAPFMRRPFVDENIFIAGEAFSDRHSWIEGAFCSAELVLREWFFLKPPEWLEEEEEQYYLGW